MQHKLLLDMADGFTSRKSHQGVTKRESGLTCFLRWKHFFNVENATCTRVRNKYLEANMQIRQKSLCALIGHSLDVELAGVHTSLPHPNPHQYDHYRKHHVCLI